MVSIVEWIMLTFSCSTYQGFKFPLTRIREDIMKRCNIMKVTIIMVILVLCPIHGWTTPILSSDPDQPSNAGDGTIQTWLIASINIYDTTHDPNLSTDAVSAHPDIKVIKGDPTAPLAYLTFPTGVLSITLPDDLNDHFVLHWGGPGVGSYPTFDLTTTPEELDTFYGGGGESSAIMVVFESALILLLGSGLLVFGLWRWRMKSRSTLNLISGTRTALLSSKVHLSAQAGSELLEQDRGKVRNGLIPSQLDLLNTADRFTAHTADFVRMGEVPNFQKVSDDLYRSGQPTPQGLKDLKSLGIRTVVNLRSFHSNAQETRKTGLDYEQIRIKGWYPKEKQVIKFLRLVTDNRKTPVLVHCQYGRHRTASICGVYRIAVQGWTPERALAEMIEAEYGFHRMLDGNAVHWINKLNMPKIKRKAAIKESDTPKLREARHLSILSN